MKVEDLVIEYLMQCVRQGTGADRVKSYGYYSKDEKTIFTIAASGRFKITNDSITEPLRLIREDGFYKTLEYHSFNLPSGQWASEFSLSYQIDNSELYS